MSDGKMQFKKSLKLKDIVFLTMGVIVGAGIYAIIGEAAGMAGNMLWLSFIVAGFVAFLTALSYAEFVSRFPDAGGSFEYIKRTFNLKTAVIFGIIAAFTGIVSSAAIAISFGDYLTRLWDIPNLPAVIGIIVLMGLINILGIDHSSRTNIIATTVTIGGLLLVIIPALPKFGEAPLLKMPEEGISGIIAAGALIFFAYVGFEDVVKTSEETKNPHTTVSKGILISSVLVTLIYILTAISVVHLKAPNELAGSASPLALAAQDAIGKWAVTALIIVALFATSNSILTNVLGTARLLFDISRDTKAKRLEKLTRINPKLKTPVYATILIVLIVIAFALIGNIKVVASISNVLICTLFFMVNFSLVKWRFDNPNSSKPKFKAPLNIKNIPLTAVFGTIFLALLIGFNVYNIINNPGIGH